MENDTTKMYLYIPDEPWNSLYYAMLPVIQNPENRNRVALGSGFRREFLRIPFDEEVASELVILYHLATYHDVCRVTQQFVAEAFVMHWYRESFLVRCSQWLLIPSPWTCSSNLHQH